MSQMLLTPAATAEHREVLRQALADTVYYRDPPLMCPACQTPDRAVRRMRHRTGPCPRLPGTQPRIRHGTIPLPFCWMRIGGGQPAAP